MATALKPTTSLLKSSYDVDESEASDGGDSDGVEDLIETQDNANSPAFHMDSKNRPSSPDIAAVAAPFDPQDAGLLQAVEEALLDDDDDDDDFGLKETDILGIGATPKPSRALKRELSSPDAGSMVATKRAKGRLFFEFNNHTKVYQQLLFLV